MKRQTVDKVINYYKLGFIEMLLNEATAYNGLAVQAPTKVCSLGTVRNVCVPT